jgi:hypothetical protein
VAGVSAITSFARVWTWVALAATLVVLAGLVQHLWPAWRRRGTRPRVHADV